MGVQKIVAGILLSAFFAGAAVAAVRVGDSAPAFRLKNAAGQYVSLSDFRGRTVLVNFWASWCAPCQQELPEMIRLSKEYSPEKLTVIAINVDENPKAGRTFLSKRRWLGTRVHFLFDPGSRTVSRYDIPAMPTTFILDPQGRVHSIHPGYRSGDEAHWRESIPKR